MLRNVLIVALLASIALAIPQGFATFFDAAACPPGWKPLLDAQGRLIVSVKDPNQAGITVNNPLGDAEDRVHSHVYSTSVQVPEKEISAATHDNNQAGSHGAIPVSSATQNSTSGYPFSQMLLCYFANASDNSHSVAYGTIGYFNPDVQSCPKEWTPVAEANGRLLVPGYQRGGMIPNSAPPLRSGEDRIHSHDYKVQFATRDVSFIGATGCCDHGPAKQSTLTVEGTTATASTGLPYIQLLTCVSTSSTFNQSLPGNALVFNEISCPPGWDLVDEASGRMLVALPEGGRPGASFGGNSLPPSSPTNPFHQHTVSGSINIPPSPVELGSGCCGNGYAGEGKYDYSGPSAAQTDLLPYTMAPLCRYSGNPGAKIRKVRNHERRH